MIGIFDSGVGGLTVLGEYLKKYPEFDYVYLGDQANVPYGNRSSEAVSRLVRENVDFLVKKGCQLIIMACNTASAGALCEVQARYQGKPPILGVLIPAAEEALKATRFGRIGVIGTRGTVKSGAYERELNKAAPELYKPTDKRAEKSVRITAQACPLLVPLIEEGLEDSVVTKRMLKTYLQPLRHAHVDTLILGCTHYPLIEKDIVRLMGRQVRVISSATAALEAIGPWFTRHADIFKKLSRNGTRTFYTTDDPERFSELGSRFLGQPVKAELLKF